MCELNPSHEAAGKRRKLQASEKQRLPGSSGFLLAAVLQRGYFTHQCQHVFTGGKHAGKTRNKFIMANPNGKGVTKTSSMNTHLHTHAIASQKVVDGAIDKLSTMACAAGVGAQRGEKWGRTREASYLNGQKVSNSSADEAQISSGLFQGTDSGNSSDITLHSRLHKLTAAV
jgi:hypothetical protein